MSRLVKASEILRSSVEIESFLISQGDKKPSSFLLIRENSLLPPLTFLAKYIYFVEIGQHPFLTYPPPVFFLLANGLGKPLFKAS